MVQYKDWISKITKALQDHPKGMAVTEISRALNISRNSISKYLDIMRISGQIDMKRFGPAKVYYLSQRVPITALLNFSSDSIMVLDEDLRIIQCNNNLLKLFNLKFDLVVDVKLEEANIPLLSDNEMLDKIKKGKDRKGDVIDIDFNLSETTRFFKLKMIPTRLGDGGSGITLILEDFSESKNLERTLRENEEKYRALFDNSQDGIILWDGENLFECNETAMAMFGCDDLDYFREHFHELSPPTQPNGRSSEECFQINRQKVIERGFLRADWVYRRIDGTDFQCEVIINRLLLGGKPIEHIVIRDITERKSIEVALRESEMKYRTLFERSSEGLFLIEDDRISDLNTASMHIFGFSLVEGIKDRSIFDILPLKQPDGQGSILKMKILLDNCRKIGSSIDEWIFRRSDGSTFYADITLTRIRLSGSELIQMTIRDVDDVKRSKIALEEKDREMRSILSSLYESYIFLMDTDLNIISIYGSPELDKRYGLQASSVEGMNIRDLLAPDDADLIGYKVRLMIEDVRPFQVEIPVEFPTDKYWEEMIFSTIPDQDGVIRKIVVYGRDVTERKEADMIRIRHTKALKMSSDAICFTDLQGKVIDVNDSFIKLMGIDNPDDVLGTDALNLLSGDNRIKGEKNMARLGKRGVMGNSEYSIRTRDGRSLAVENRSIRISDESGNPWGFVTFTRNIEDRKWTRDNLTRLENVLNAARKIIEEEKKDEEISERFDRNLTILGTSIKISMITILRLDTDGKDSYRFSLINGWADDLSDGRFPIGQTRILTLNHDVIRGWIHDLSQGKNIQIELEDIPQDVKDEMKLDGMGSLLMIPIIIDEKLWGSLEFINMKEMREWYPSEVDGFVIISKMFGSILGSKK